MNSTSAYSMDDTTDHHKSYKFTLFTHTHASHTDTPLEMTMDAYQQRQRTRQFTSFFGLYATTMCAVFSFVDMNDAIRYPSLALSTGCMLYAYHILTSDLSHRTIYIRESSGMIYDNDCLLQKSLEQGLETPPRPSIKTSNKPKIHAIARSPLDLLTQALPNEHRYIRDLIRNRTPFDPNSPTYTIMTHDCNIS